jgi:hypothetical protein
MSNITPRFIFMTTAAMGAPSPAFETLEPHEVVEGARVLPSDGRFTIDGDEWTVRGARAVKLAADRRPYLFIEITGPVTICKPARIEPGKECAFSVGYTDRSLIVEATEPPIVLTAFGRAKGGDA